MCRGILILMLMHLTNAATCNLKNESYTLSQPHEHYLQCIQNISGTYFKSEDLVIIQTPHMWRNSGQYQKYLSQIDVVNEFEDNLINSLENYNVVLYGPVQDLEAINHTLLKPDVIVLLLNQGIETRVVQLNLLKCMLLRIRSNAWNTDAKCLIISLDTFQTKKQHDEFVFEVLSLAQVYLRLTNVIVLTPKYEKPNYTMANELLDVSVYPWFPFSKKGQCCRRVAEVALVDYWQSKEGSFKWKKDLFSLQRYNKLQWLYLSWQNSLRCTSCNDR